MILFVLCYVLLCLSGVSLFLYYYFTKTFNYWKERNIPGPKPVVFYGNLKESTLRKKLVSEVQREIYTQYSSEKVVGIYKMTAPCLLIRDLDIIKQVMIKDFALFIDRGIEFSKKGLGYNLFHADPETWQVLRSKFTPIFTSGKIKNMFYLLNEKGDEFIEYVDNKCVDNQVQNMFPVIQKYMLASISACAFGMNTKFSDDIMDVFKIIDTAVFKTSIAHELIFVFPIILKKFGHALFPRIVNDFFTDLVRNILTTRNGKPCGSKDFMDLILELNQNKEAQGNAWNNNESLNIEINERVMAGQAFIFFVAGYETSSATLTFMLYELAVNLDIQDKVIAEIKNVLQNGEKDFTYDSLQEMTYLSKVFDETLRKYPIGDVIQRAAKDSYKLPGTDITIEKGQLITVSLLGIHHDEKYYPNPSKFDPERFNAENSGNRHSCAYMPFGTGPRNCIGMRFAKVQTLVCAVKLLSKYRVEPSSSLQKPMKFDPCRMILNPNNLLLPLHLRLIKKQD